MNEPGCYGMIVAYSDSTDTCSQCGHKQRCSVIVAQALDFIAEKMDVSDLVYIANRDTGFAKVRDQTELSLVTDRIERKTKVAYRFELSDEQRRIISYIKGKYSKAERLIRSMFKNGIDLKEALRRNINPYRGLSKHAYMDIVCEKLLNGGFTRSELRTAFSDAYEWNYGTANSHVLICTHTLTALDVVRENESGKFILQESI